MRHWSILPCGSFTTTEGLYGHSVNNNKLFGMGIISKLLFVDSNDVALTPLRQNSHETFQILFPGKRILYYIYIFYFLN